VAGFCTAVLNGKAELENVTDPNMIFDLKAKLDAAGHYDDFEIERVVSVELDPKAKQSDLQRALDPVATRIVEKFKTAQKTRRTAQEIRDEEAEKAAREIMDALEMFKRDMQTFLRRLIPLLPVPQHLDGRRGEHCPAGDGAGSSEGRPDRGSRRAGRDAPAGQA